MTELDLRAQNSGLSSEQLGFLLPLQHSSAFLCSRRELDWNSGGLGVIFNEASREPGKTLGTVFHDLAS